MTQFEIGRAPQLPIALFNYSHDVGRGELHSPTRAVFDGGLLAQLKNLSGESLSANGRADDKSAKICNRTVLEFAEPILHCAQDDEI